MSANKGGNVRQRPLQAGRPARAFLCAVRADSERKTASALTRANAELKNKRGEYHEQRIG